MAKPRKGLTPRQDTFAKNVAKGGSQAQAARDAGYVASRSHTTGSELMLNPLVRHAVELYRASAEAKHEVTRDRVVNRIAEIGHVAFSAGDFGPALKAQELLGRALGAFVDRSQNINVNVDASAAQLQGLIEAANRRRSAAKLSAIDVSHSEVLEPA